MVSLLVGLGRREQGPHHCQGDSIVQASAEQSPEPVTAAGPAHVLSIPAPLIPAPLILVTLIPS